MRCCQAVVRADQLAVDPRTGFPMWTFQPEQDAAFRPFAWDLNIPLVPCGAFVIFLWLQPKGYLHLSSFAVRRVFRGREPGAVNNASRPRRVRRDLVADPLCREC